MTDTHTPIDPTTIDCTALLDRFWTPAPVQTAKYRNFASYRYISQDDVAAALGVTQATVSGHLDKGSLPIAVEWVMGRRHIMRASFEAYLAERQAA